MEISKYYDKVKYYTTLPKDIGFDYMETVLSEMEDDGMTFPEAYACFCEMVDYVFICEA